MSGQKAGEPNRTFASAFSYAPHGGVSQYTYGNGLVEQTTFNSRLQPTAITLSSNPFPYQPFGIQLDYGTTNNNGNVLSQARGGLIQTYTYDEVNRLKSAQEGSGPTFWKQEYDYDRFGNRRFNAATTANVMGPNPQIDQATNRFLVSEGYVYDEAGNLKQEPGKSYKYDTENRLTDFNNGAAFYGYDGDGRRVKKTVGSEVTVFVYNIAGQLVAEYRNTPVELGGGTSFLTMDHLGSIRMVTHRNGDIKSRHDYLPFGEELSVSRAVQSYYFQPDGLNQKFTGKERDQESGLDYFINRYYSSAQGRFTTTDPTLLSVSAFNPQSWNRYAYVLNNPLLYIDPLGLWEIYAGDPVYKTNKDGSYKLDKKGNKVIDYIPIFARKTKANDDGASLAKQLGLTGKDAAKFAEKVGSGNNIRLAEQSGDVGRVFDRVEDGLTDQAKWEAKNADKLGELAKKNIFGPDHSDCSRTACEIGLGSFGELQVGTNLLDPRLGTDARPVSASDGRIGDIIRYANSSNVAKHFTNFIFRNDDGTPVAFSKSGTTGRYEIRKAAELQGDSYGTIRGINSGESGYYRRR